MPKTKKRKYQKNQASAAKRVTQERSEQVAPARMAQRPVRYTRGAGLQNVGFAAMVALGFLGLTVFFAFFYSEDANHYLYAGLAGLTGLGWVVLLARRWSQYRQRA